MYALVRRVLASFSHARSSSRLRRRQFRPCVEGMEGRLLLSATGWTIPVTALGINPHGTTGVTNPITTDLKRIAHDKAAIRLDRMAITSEQVKLAADLKAGNLLQIQNDQAQLQQDQQQLTLDRFQLHGDEAQLQLDRHPGG